MENASKALLIAGGMLLFILVASFATLLFRRMGSQTSEFYKDMSDTEIYEFNQQFFNYEGRELRIQDVVSIINLARDANKREVVPVIVKVYFQGNDSLETNVDGSLKLDRVDTKSILSKSINDDINTRYSCKVEYAKNSNYVGIITISKNTT